MFNRASFWQRDVYRFGVATCLVFIVCTIAAMLFYPGGTVADPTTKGYSFTQNFFSDLGRTATQSGQANTASMVLFIIAMVVVSAGLALFFIAFTRFFVADPPNRWLSRIAAGVACVTAACFVGVAAAPYDHFYPAHVTFVNWAFRTFPLAVALDAIAIFRTPALPRWLGWVFVAFTVLLVGYIGLLTFGPSSKTAAGEVIQVVGQKIIVYASIISILIEALGVLAVQRVSASPENMAITPLHP